MPPDDPNTPKPEAIPPPTEPLDKLEPAPPASPWEKITLFVFGTFFFIVLLVIAWLAPNPSNTSWFIYICVLAMAAGGVAALLPGAINVSLHPGIRAGGALAIAVLVFYFGKDRVQPPPPPVNTTVQGLSSYLAFPSPVDPIATDVYVVINSKLAVYNHGGSGPKDLDFGANDWKGTKHVVVNRGFGGITIAYGMVSQGDTVEIIAKDQSGHWWMSNDMVVPQGELAMNTRSVDDIKVRVEYVP